MEVGQIPYSNPINKPKKKRTVNKEEWTKEKRKRLRIAGKEYINAKGETVPPKAPGPNCKCRRRCYDKISESTRMKLFNGYYSLKSHDEQNAYLFGLIRKVPIARKRAEGSTRRTCTFNYYIRINGQETQVCVKALANIHGVGKSKIHILCEKLGQSILFPRDERGRHSKMPKKVTEDTVELVRAHIYSIIHTDKAKDFLKDEKANNGPDVNITAMHKDFLDLYDPEFQEEVVVHQNPGHQGTFELANGEYRQVQFVTMETQTQTPVMKRKRKIMKDGRPEPLIRQWYYSKIFHDLYTTKEAIALRKKIINWKCSEDFVVVKPMRKQRQQKKMNNGQEQRMMKSTHTNTPTTIMLSASPPPLQAKKYKEVELQIQNIPLKKKPVQVFQATPTQDGSNMYSIYPMTILQDLAQIETAQAVNLTHAQTLQPTQIRTIGPTHFQTVGQPHVTTTNGVAISPGNLQALQVNLNLAQTATHYANHSIMGYKFEGL